MTTPGALRLPGLRWLRWLDIEHLMTSAEKGLVAERLRRSARTSNRANQ